MFVNKCNSFVRLYQFNCWMLHYPISCLPYQNTNSLDNNTTQTPIKLRGIDHNNRVNEYSQTQYITWLLVKAALFPIVTSARRSRVFSLPDETNDVSNCASLVVSRLLLTAADISGTPAEEQRQHQLLIKKQRAQNTQIQNNSEWLVLLLSQKSITSFWLISIHLLPQTNASSLIKCKVLKCDLYQLHLSMFCLAYSSFMSPLVTSVLSRNNQTICHKKKHTSIFCNRHSSSSSSSQQKYNKHSWRKT